MRKVVPYFLQALLAAYIIYGVAIGDEEHIDVAIMVIWMAITLGWICIPLPAAEFFRGPTRALPLITLSAISLAVIVPSWLAGFKITATVYLVTWLLLALKKWLWSHEQKMAWGRT